MHKLVEEFIEEKLELGDFFGCFSFQEIKIMTTGGDGGNGVYEFNKFVKDLKTLSYHGWDQDPFERHQRSIQKYKN